MGRRVLLFGFRVQGQYPELVRLISHELDHPQPAALACAITSPPQFPQSARPLNNRSRFRVLHHKLLQLAVFIVIEVASPHTIKCCRLYKDEHSFTLRLWRIFVKQSRTAEVCWQAIRMLTKPWPEGARWSRLQANAPSFFPGLHNCRAGPLAGGWPPGRPSALALY